MRSHLRLRFDYGHVPAVARGGRRGCATAVAGPDAVLVTTPVPLERDGARPVSYFDVRAGQRVPFVLTHYQAGEPPPLAGRRRGRADRHRGVLERLDRPAALRRPLGPERCAARSSCSRRSPTRSPAAIVAAATTSLPERARRLAQLGLPLLLAARRLVHAAGAARHRLRRGGEGLAGVAAARRGRRPGGPADHVRPRRLAPHPGVRAGLAGRLRGLQPGPDRQRGLRAAPARRVGRGARDAAPGAHPRHGGHRGGLDRPGRPARAPGARPGASRTTGCGRCVGRSGTSCTPRCWPGWAWTGWSRPPSAVAWTHPLDAVARAAPADPRRRLRPTGSTRSATPSPSSTARRGWTRRCCCCPRWASCRGTTRGSSAPSTRSAASWCATGS